MPHYSLDSVTIDGFRGLRNLWLDNLGRINILVGRNHSGKTSVLEALSILRNAEDPFEWLWMVQRRDFGGLDETRIQSLRWCFSQSRKLAESDAEFKGECTMDWNGATSLCTLCANYRDIQGEPIRRADKKLEARLLPGEPGLISTSNLDDEPRRGAEIMHRLQFGDPFILGRRTKGEVAMRVWDGDPTPAGPPPLRRSPPMVETLTPASYQISSDQIQYHSRSQFAMDRDLVLDLIRELDPEITDIRQVSIRGLTPAIYLGHRRLGQAPLSVFGDALRRAVLLAAMIVSLKDGGILLIDEVETGFHVSVLERVFRWIAGISRQLDVQIFATTQSLEAVDAMAVAAADGKTDLVAYHLDQTMAKTQVKRIDGDLLRRLRRERGLDVR